MADNGYTVAQAYIQIMPSTKNFGSTLKGDINPEVNKTGKSAGSSFSSGFKKALGITTAVVAAAAAATGKLTMAAIEAFGEYEQLTGGVEKLFGAFDAETVISNASEAFKTAGMSANEYLETVTNFSASLIGSLEGDTQAAVDYADMAIKDMSDNANVFGTDMASIQNAYQGFAKQNYTMLDNLKLGYGGTKSEMERLIADANRVKVANGEMADLSIDSFADIVEAIHIMQGEMNISGTTAAEASTTIQGSINSMKAAWENLLIGLAAGDQNIGTLMSNLFETIFGVEDETGNRVGGVVNNILPRVSAVLSALSTEVRTYLPQIMAYIPQILEEVLPDLIQNATALVTAFVGELPNIINVVVQQLPLLLSSIGDALIQGFNSLTENLPSIADSLSGVLSAVLTYVSENAGTLIDSAATFLSTLLTEGINILAENSAQLASAFMAVIKALIQAAFEHPELVAAIIGMKAISSLGSTIITALGTALSNGKATLAKTIGNLVSGAFGSGSVGQAATQAGTRGGGAGLKNIGSWLTSGSTGSWAAGAGLTTLGVAGIGTGLMLGVDALYDAALRNSEAWKAEEAILADVYESTDFATAAREELTRVIGEEGLAILDNGGSWMDVAGTMTTVGNQKQALYEQFVKIGLDALYQEYRATQDLAGGFDDLGTGLEETAGKTSSTTAAMRQALTSEFSKVSMDATRVGTTMSSNFTGSMLSGQQSSVQTASNYIGATMNAMKSTMEVKQPDVTGAVSKVEAGMETSINPVKAAMTSAGNTSGANLATAFGSKRYAVEQTVRNIYNLFQNILGHSLIGEMRNWGNQAGSGFAQGFQSGGSGINSVANQISGSVSGAFGWLPGELWNVGYNAGQGLYNGLAAISGSLQSLARSIANSISATLRAALAIRSPSRVMEQIGMYTGEGLAIGIQKSSAGAISAAEDMAFGIVSAAGSTVTGINDDTVQSALAGSYSSAIAGSIQSMNNSPEQMSVVGLLMQINDRLTRLSQMQMVMDTGEVVGVLSDPINDQLASIRLREGRG